MGKVIYRHNLLEEGSRRRRFSIGASGGKRCRIATVARSVNGGDLTGNRFYLRCNSITLDFFFEMDYAGLDC
jgi:hypothetical protein